MSTQTDNARNGTQPSKSRRRWRWLAGTVGGFLAVALVYTAYWAQVLRYHQTTDDAYVGGNVVQITPQISGTVVGIAANRARVDGTTLKDHPQVRDAAAAVRNAYLTLARTELPAPVSGFVARRNVQLGQRVSPGTALMAVVPLEQVWVDANFKEPQLARMRVGQPVALTADLYGASTVFHGKVAGFGAGTGSAFALLPAQNATGNWIKIVQRVPVRIALDPREVAAHPLQIGLSMKADVDVRGGEGARLPQLAGASAAWSTDVFDSSDALADARVAAIIVANH